MATAPSHLHQFSILFVEDKGVAGGLQRDLERSLQEAAEPHCGPGIWKCHVERDFASAIATYGKLPVPVTKGRKWPPVVVLDLGPAPAKGAGPTEKSDGEMALDIIATFRKRPEDQQPRIIVRTVRTMGPIVEAVRKMKGIPIVPKEDDQVKELVRHIMEYLRTGNPRV